jgi:hypothetical protein
MFRLPETHQKRLNHIREIWGKFVPEDSSHDAKEQEAALS